VRTLVLPLLLALGCTPALVVDRTVAPAPLDARPFRAPAPATATLSNGLTVVLVENHEVPLVYGRIAWLAGGWMDPAGKAGLAAVTLDMMDEGAGERDAAALAGALQKLGAGLSTSAGDDGASLAFSALGRNLAPTLDLVADVLFRPTFPDAEWELMRKRRVAALAKARKDADSIAGRVYDAILFGDAYRGRYATEASYGAMGTADMRAWWQANLVPDGAVLLVGGDTTLAELVPLLEARLAGWKPSGKGAARPTDTARPQQSAIHFVDRPGAAQSVIRIGNYVTSPTAPEWFPLVLANMAVGGQFTARLNMNLREEKGWTYGARSGFGFDHAGGRFTASAGVHTDKTVPAVREFWKEIADAAGARPVTAEELANGRDSLVLGRPLQFESPDWRLGQEESTWRYRLPADWVTGWGPRVQGVTLAQAQAAWATLAKAPMVTLVVGDGAVVREPLAALAAEAGVPFLERDVDGVVLTPASPEKK
jgi:predicted Zn-dependent peptidase